MRGLRGKGGWPLSAFLGGVQCSRMERKRISETNRASMERINLPRCLVSCHFHILLKKIDKLNGVFRESICSWCEVYPTKGECSKREQESDSLTLSLVEV